MLRFLTLHLILFAKLIIQVIFSKYFFMKQLEITLYFKEIADDAALAVSFSAARGVDAPEDFDRKTMTDNDKPLIAPLFRLVWRRIAVSLNPYISSCTETGESVVIRFMVRDHNESKAAELIPFLIHSAAVSLLVAEWERTTSPAESDAALSFAETRLQGIKSVLDHPASHTARRPLFPF